MINCKSCGHEMSDESSFCNQCGSKVISPKEKESNGIENQPIISTEEVKENRSNKKKIYLNSILTLVLLLILGGGGWYFYSNYMTPQGQAKNVVEKYLKAAMNAESTYEYKNASVDDFINVLNYKFVRYGEKTKKHRVEEVSEDEYIKYKDILYKDLSYNNYWIKYTNLYKSLDYQVISEVNRKIVFESPDEYSVIKVIFDMEVTNGVGNKIYKKVFFELDDKSGDFRISDISY